LFCSTNFSDKPAYFAACLMIARFSSAGKKPPLAIAGKNLLTVNCSTSGSNSSKSFACKSELRALWYQAVAAK